MKERFDLIQALELMDMGEKVLNTKHNSVFWFENGKLKSNDNYCSLSIHSQSLLAEKVWELYEEPKPILDTEEKAYLEGVIRPFKDEITHIKKYRNIDNKKECIDIFSGETYMISLPPFPLGTMYKGMTPHKEYTIKELGLFDRKIY